MIMEEVKKLTFAEIVAVLNELGVTPQILDQDFDAYNDDDFDGVAAEAAVKARLGEFKCVLAGSTGGEDRGSDYREIYEFVDHGVLVAVTGYYQSFDGTEYDDEFSEVRAGEKNVVYFEEVKKD